MTIPGSILDSATIIGPGGAAPADALYLVLATNPLLTAERVFTPTTGITAADGGAGGAYTVTIDLSTGVAGGQTAIGGTGAAEDLTLQATSNVVPGQIRFESAPGVERARFVSTGEFVVSDAGVFASITADFPIQLRTSSNARRAYFMENTNSGSLAISEYIANSNNGTMSVGVTSSGFATSSGLKANQVFLNSAGTVQEINLITLGPRAIRFTTSTVERGNISGTNPHFFMTSITVTLNPQFICTNDLGNDMQMGVLGSAAVPVSGINVNDAFLQSTSTTSMYLVTTGATPIRFATTGIERARLLSTGELVIGATTLVGAELVRIAGKLRVDGVIDPTALILSGGTALFFESDDGSTAPLSGAATGRIRYDNGAGDWEISTQGAVYKRILIAGGPTFTAGSVLFAATDGTVTEDNAILFFNDTANLLGVGTPTPDELFHVAKAIDGDAVLVLFENSQPNMAASTNETAEIRFGFGGNNDVARIVAGKEGDYTSGANENSFLAFFTDLNGVDSEKVRIDSAGNVGIGTTTPDTLLEISGPGNQFLRVTSEDDSQAGIEFFRPDNADIDWRILNDGGSLFIKSSSDDFTSTSPKMAIRVGGDALFDPTTVDISLLQLRVIRASNTAGQGMGIGFVHDTSNGNVGAAIVHERTGSSSQGMLHFATKSSTDVAADIPIRMTIDENGLVGIGTVTPTSILSLQMGTGTGIAEASGRAFVNTTPVGTPASTIETDLKTYSLPANSLNTDDKLVRISAWGTIAANGNTKTIRLKFGATIIRAIGPLTLGGLDWRIDGIVIRTGATTQKAMATEFLDTVAPDTTASVPAETLSGAVVIKVTGQNGTPSANDIVAEGMLVEFLN